MNEVGHFNRDGKQIRGNLEPTHFMFLGQDLTIVWLSVNFDEVDGYTIGGCIVSQGVFLKDGG